MSFFRDSYVKSKSERVSMFRRALYKQGGGGTSGLYREFFELVEGRGRFILKNGRSGEEWVEVDEGFGSPDGTIVLETIIFERLSGSHKFPYRVFMRDDGAHLAYAALSVSTDYKRGGETAHLKLMEREGVVFMDDEDGSVFLLYPSKYA